MSVDTTTREDVGVLDFGSVPPEQRSRLQEAMAQCEAEVGELDEPASVPDREQLEARYEGLLDVYDCLEEGGFPSDPPPSLDVYVASGGTAWIPGSSIERSDVLQAAYDACPSLRRYIVSASE